MKTLSELIPDIGYFIGTERWYKNFTGIVYTDGIKYLAENASCYWLIDYIGSLQTKFHKIDFQIWNIKAKDGYVIITMKEDIGQPILHSEKLMSDFPEGEIEFYVEGMSQKVILLKSEH